MSTQFLNAPLLLQEKSPLGVLIHPSSASAHGACAICLHPTPGRCCYPRPDSSCRGFAFTPSPSWQGSEEAGFRMVR